MSRSHQEIPSPSVQLENMPSTIQSAQAPGSQQPETLPLIGSNMPCIIKPTHQENFNEMSLNDFRGVAIDAARGRVIEVPMSFFAASVLREVSDSEVKTMRDTLEASGHINKTTGRWSDFEEPPAYYDQVKDS